eukprot:3158032-Amphidinium_carterae.1
MAAQNGPGDSSLARAGRSARQSGGTQISHFKLEMSDSEAQLLTTQASKGQHNFNKKVVARNKAPQLLGNKAF